MVTQTSLSKNIKSTVEPASNLSVASTAERRDCVMCGYHLKDGDVAASLTPFSCNLRPLADEVFHVWRCPQCETIHCLETVDLDYYYSKYPDEELGLNAPLRLLYSGLHNRLRRHGFTDAHKLLDYGCGKGLFLQYLKEKGYRHGFGYDPYDEPKGFGDASVLENGPFDYILLSDVIEHVEDPRELLRTLDRLLSPGGRIMIGAPNAKNLDLTRPQFSDYYNEVHVPYHLHIYTRESVERLGKEQGWAPVGFFERAYYDSPWLGLNARAWNVYQRMGDGTFNVVAGDPIQWGRALSSPTYLFYALFGYWLSFRTGMDVVFEKRG